MSKTPLQDLSRALPGIIISLVVLVILFSFVDWPELILAFSQIDLRFLALHGLLYMASVAARAMGARALLEDRPTFRDSFMIMMQGYLLNNVLPFRLGELGRAYLLGRKTGLGTFFTIPAVMIERAYDLAFAGLIVIGTLPFVFSDVEWARPAALTALSLVTVGLLSLHLVARFRVPLRKWADTTAGRIGLIERYILPRIDSFLDGLAVLTSLKSFSVSLGWMALAWLFALGNQYALLLGFLPDAKPLFSSFALGISSFGGAIPSAPSALGVYHGAVVVAFGVVGVSSGIGLAFATTHHIMHFLYSGLFGMFAFSREGESLMSMYQKLTSKKNTEEKSNAP
jgi:glycosyltransferase 2 family protein